MVYPLSYYSFQPVLVNMQTEVLLAFSGVIIRGSGSTHGSSDRSLMVDPLSYYSLQPVFHN